MLEVVQDEEERTVAQERDESVQRLGRRESHPGSDLPGHEVVVVDRGQLHQDGAVAGPPSEALGDLLRQTRLPGTAGTGERDQPGRLQQRLDLLHLAIPADERVEPHPATRRRSVRCPGVGHRLEQSRVLPEHALVHGGQGRPGIDAELVRQCTPGRRERRERLTLAPLASQGPQQQFADAFPPWLFPPELLQRRDHRREVRGGRRPQQRFRPELDGLDPSLPERGTGLRVEGLAGQIGQDRAPPQRERALQGSPGSGRLPVGHGSPALSGQLSEQQQVAFVLREPQPVGATDGLDPLDSRVPLVVERLAPGGHVGLDDARRARRRPRAPEAVDDGVQTAELVGPEGEQCEQRAPSRPARPNGHAPAGHVQRT